MMMHTPRKKKSNTIWNDPIVCTGQCIFFKNIMKSGNPHLATYHGLFGDSSYLVKPALLAATLLRKVILSLSLTFLSPFVLFTFR
jgi:hypothetical protein